MDPGVRQGGEELAGAERGEILIRVYVYCVRGKIYFQ